MNAILFGTSSAIALAALASAAIDLTPAVSAWARRIGIGRFPDEAAWRKAAAERAMKWLIRTPTVRLTDQTRLLWLDMLRGEYKRAAIQHWQEAALVLGLTELACMGGEAGASGMTAEGGIEASGGAAARGRAGADAGGSTEDAAGGAIDALDARFRTRLRAVLERFLARKFGADGSWRVKPEQVDAAMLAYAVMRSGMEPDRYRRAFDETAELVLGHIGEDGLVRYRPGAVGGYRYVDTIGLVCPFLAAYGLAYGREDCVDLAVRQIEAYGRYGLHPEIGLPYHAYAVCDGRPLGLCAWGRGLAWYAIGLAEVWRLLPASDRRKAEMEARVAKLARAAARFQQPDGSWRWTVTRPEARADSSATAALAWFLLRSAAASGAPEDARDRARRALAYLRGVTRRCGAVDFAQGDTRDIGVYAQRFEVLPFAQGFALRAAAAMEQAEAAERADPSAADPMPAGVAKRADPAAMEPMPAEAAERADPVAVEPMPAEAAERADPAALEAMLAEAVERADPAAMEPMPAKAAERANPPASEPAGRRA